MRKLILLLLFLFFYCGLKAQNLFPYKLDNCITERFCLDCGDQKASVNQEKFNALVVDLNRSNTFTGITGKLLVQVIIDSIGNGCVLSHTDKSNSRISKEITKRLNAFDGWLPAITKGKIEGRTSVNLTINILNGTLTANIQRVDQKAFLKSFDRPVDPEVYNNDYVYKNTNLKQYDIKVWNSSNSNLPNNMDDHIIIDLNNMIWLTVDDGLVKFDGNTFINAEQNIPLKGDRFHHSALSSDSHNVKWIYAKSNIYSYYNDTWTKYDPEKTGIKYVYKITSNPKTDEIFFCSDSGLVIKHGELWTNLNISNTIGLPSNRIFYAQRDFKGQLWIGTLKGTVLIDKNNKLINFENTKSELKGKCITSMTEDEDGNLYFSLYEYNRKDKKLVNNDEGFASYNSKGETKQYTTSNSGMPFNHVTQLLYDKNEKVLWIATDRAGLVRYDLKQSWENYHNKNSAIPTSYISDMEFDKDGVLYLATRQGLVKLERKSK